MNVILLRQGWTRVWFVGTALHVYVTSVYGVSQCWLCVFTGNEEYPRAPFSAWLRLQKGGGGVGGILQVWKNNSQRAANSQKQYDHKETLATLQC